MKSKSEMRRLAIQDPLGFVERMIRLEAVLSAAREHIEAIHWARYDAGDGLVQAQANHVAEQKLDELRAAIRLCDSQEDGKGEGG